LLDALGTVLLTVSLSASERIEGIVGNATPSRLLEV
jgi:hypothetical protein